MSNLLHHCYPSKSRPTRPHGSSPQKQNPNKSTSSLYPSHGAVELCTEVLARSQGCKLISTAQKAKELPRGVKTRFLLGSGVRDIEVGEAVFEDYLPAALEEGRFVPAPEPLVVRKDLDAVQDGLDA